MNFWENVAVGDEAECWPWQRSRMSRGYGAVRIDGERWLAHRYAYTSHVRAIPPGLKVCHTCDNPICCNPSHLFVGTHLENMADMRAKGRSRAGDRHWTKHSPERIARGENATMNAHPELRPKGERNGRAKLSEADVRLIRRLANEGVSVREMTQLFAVGEGAIFRILSGKRWGHLI